jgi:hypothetical protein
MNCDCSLVGLTLFFRKGWSHLFGDLLTQSCVSVNIGRSEKEKDKRRHDI